MEIKDCADKIRENIAKALVGTGRNLSDVKIIAATKTVSADRINLLPSCGITVAGENRVQELIEKFDSVRGLQWHFIGNLQTNKVKYVIDKVTLIHSVDREALADEIDRQSAKIGKVQDVLIEVNMGREESKGGVLPENLDSLVSYVLGKKHLRLKGLMSVLPIGADESLYEELHGLYSGLRSSVGDGSIDILSAGMSGDYETAVKHGANLVRIGSALFGARNYAKA